MRRRAVLADAVKMAMSSSASRTSGRILAVRGYCSLQVSCDLVPHSIDAYVAVTTSVPEYTSLYASGTMNSVSVTVVAAPS